MARPVSKPWLSLLCLSPLTFGASHVAPAVLGCSNCPPHAPIQKFEGGHQVGEGLFETGAPDEPMLHFFGGEAYEIEHGLGRIPASVTPYISFSPTPYDLPKSSGIAHTTLGAGNIVLYERWDDQAVVVRNDTCSDFYLRVVIEAGTGGAGGAGGAP